MINIQSVPLYDFTDKCGMFQKGRVFHRAYNTAHYKSYIFVFCTEIAEAPYRELFIWAVFFNRKSLANFFWSKCENPIGSALVATKLCKSLAKKADSPALLSLANELKASAGFVEELLQLQALRH